MATKGECELCGFADDSYRIDENGTVMKVCKFCHDGYLERMGLSPEADAPVEDVALTLDLSEIQKAGIDTEGMSGAELLQLQTELAARKNTKVPSLNEEQLDTLLTATEDEKRILYSVRQKEMRRKKKEADAGLDDSGEDYKASEELIRSGEELQHVVEELKHVTKEPPAEDDAKAAPLIAKIVAPRQEDNAQAAPQAPTQQDSAHETVSKETDMSEKEKKTGAQASTRIEKEERVRERIHAAANQTSDDERIRITSPEVELRKDKRPKTNLDVAISEFSGGVRFLDAFKYVLHRVSYAVFLGLIVLAVSTVLFIRDGYKHGLIVLGGGIGAVALGFVLVWYLSRCYGLDRRALLLRIRQQEILFASMRSDCYRELRTKFTVIKALGWLLNKLSVLLPLVVLVGGNVAAVIVAFLQAYWLFPVISAGATVAGVLVYYIVKFAADWIAYALDRERNQQVQQQTLLDILESLKK